MLKQEYLTMLLTSEDVVEKIKLNIEKLIEVIPEIKGIIGFEHKHKHHHLDVWEHTLMALSFSENDLVVRLALLLHDIGKPECCTEKDGYRHFYGHPKVSAEKAKAILERVGFSKDIVEEVVDIIKNHHSTLNEEDVLNNYELSYKIYCHQKCDALAHKPCKNPLEHLEGLKIILEKYKAENITLS